MNPKKRYNFFWSRVLEFRSDHFGALKHDIGDIQKIANLQFHNQDQIQIMKTNLNFLISLPFPTLLKPSRTSKTSRPFFYDQDQLQILQIN